MCHTNERPWHICIKIDEHLNNQQPIQDLFWKLPVDCWKMSLSTTVHNAQIAQITGNSCVPLVLSHFANIVPQHRPGVSVSWVCFCCCPTVAHEAWGSRTPITVARTSQSTCKRSRQVSVRYSQSCMAMWLGMFTMPLLGPRLLMCCTKMKLQVGTTEMAPGN